MSVKRSQHLLWLLGLAAIFGTASTTLLHLAADRRAAGNAPQDVIGSRLPARPGEPVPGVSISTGALLATSLPDLAGRSHALGEWEGHPMVLNFWATWCQPCLEELPLLTQAAQDPALKDAVILGIALDEQPAVERFLKRHDPGYSTLIEAGGVGGALVNRLGDREGAMPFTALLDRHGNVVETRLGPWHAGELEARLAALLKP